MASSAKWLGRIGSALHGGKAAAESTSGTRRLMAQAAEIPEGYALTSSGLLVPWPNHVALKGFDLGVRQFERSLLEKMEKSSSLAYRMTKCIVSMVGCGFALKLTWYEVTDTGNLHYYLPGIGQAPTLGYVSKQALLREQKGILQEKGFCDQDIGEAQLSLMALITASAAERSNARKEKPKGLTADVPESAKPAAHDMPTSAPGSP